MTNAAINPDDYSELELAQAEKIKALEFELAEMKLALKKIAELDRHEDSSEMNEFAEAECFHKAQRFAHSTLNLHNLRASY